MSFYETLPSDSSMHFFPENKISHFKTQLPSPVCLNGEWEVGLSEIIYPHSWLNVNETNNYFLYKAGDGNISSTVKRTIDVGCYETMLDIISAVQLALPKNPNRFTIIYNKATKRVKINAVQGSSLHLENLGELLGFKRNAIIIGNMKSEFVADAWSNFSVFYVYSDLISLQIVGDTQAPLLRIVRTKGKDGETISQYYDRPQYLPLVRHSFQTIQSELRLNSGDFVPFERGQIGSGLTHYKGINFQKGYGIGGIFRRLFRAALPFLVKGGKTIGKVLMTGSRVASDVLSGENFKEAVKTRSRESGKKLAQKAIDRVQSMVGKGQYKRKHSPECVKSELELFNLPGTQTVIQDGQWKQFHPLSNVFDNAPVEFHISGSAEDYIDLSQTQLYVKAKIVKVDNTPITKDDTIGPVNLFLHSLFSQVDVSLNDRGVSNSSNTYPYRSYIETLLNHGYDSKTSQLTAELFYKDSDDGLKKRTEFFKESATVDMIGCIHSDLFHQDRLLLNLVDLKIKLIRSKPEFCLQGSEGFKVVLDHVSLFIRKVRVNPGVILGHAKALEKTNAKYPINRVLCKVYSIPKGSMSFIQDNIFSGQMPKKLFVGCVDNEAFHGAFSKSPYEFKHFNLNFIGVYVDGQPVPHNPLELDFSKDQYIRAYQTLFVGTDRMGQDRGIFISRKEYKDSNTLFGFNLSPDLCSSGEHLSLIKHSNLRLELKFSKSLEQTVCVIVFAEFENLIEINKSRNILYDFGN
ncbi:uncharacterized protein F54H12.2 [Trichonephila clavipes]|nr:uncharacterized protein F54H12.2 [Trichonephila clavipes]